MGNTSVPGGDARAGLSSEKREDIWALLIAAAILLLALAAPEAVYTFFKKALFIF